MTEKKRQDEFVEGKQRIEEIGRRLGEAFGQGKAAAASGGLFSGLTGLIEQLGKLAEQADKAGGTTTKTGEFSLGPGGRTKGVFGFTVKSGLGNDGVKVEPFGNIRKDDTLGQVQIHEIREPMVDVFDETDHLLVILEVPGITREDVHLELSDDILVFHATRGEKKYRKEVLLPASYSPDQMSYSCHGGILEIRIAKGKPGG